MPFEVYDYPQVVVFKGKVYIGGGWASSDREMQTVIVYDPQQDSFDTLPPYTYKWFSMSIVNNQLVLVGGLDVQTVKVTNMLAVWNEESRKWTHPLPPMTTACYSPSVVVYRNKWLVIMGGFDDRTSNSLSRVEILDSTESGRWYQAAPLPQMIHEASAVTIGNICYLLGGYSGGRVPSSRVYSVCLDDLISQAVPQPVSTSAPSTPSPWTTMPDTPLEGSTALCLNGALMTVGGSEWRTTYIDIYHYQPSIYKELDQGWGAAC